MTNNNDNPNDKLTEATKRLGEAAEDWYTAACDAMAEAFENAARSLKERRSKQ